MVGSWIRLAAAAALCAALGACAGTSGPYGESRGPVGTVTTPDAPMQCVPYARARSHIAIYGDASTWWDQAQGRYARADVPEPGAVMVLHNYAGPDRAHLAFVRAIVDSRQIRVDHANWLDDGAVYENDPVQDVSPANDWSLVRVFNLKTDAWGTRTYEVQGFIGPGPDAAGHIAKVTGKRDSIAALLSEDSDRADDDN